MTPVIYAMATMVFYIAALGVGNFIIRKKAVVSGAVPFNFFKIYDTNKYTQIPEFVIRYGRHFDHQFQLPPLFLITCLTCFNVPINETYAALLAWAFVISRFVHSAIHLTTNKVLLRAQAYGIGLLCVVILWLLIVQEVITSQ